MDTILHLLSIVACIVLVASITLFSEEQASSYGSLVGRWTVTTMGLRDYTVPHAWIVQFATDGTLMILGTDGLMLGSGIWWMTGPRTFLSTFREAVEPAADVQIVQRGRLKDDGQTFHASGKGMYSRNHCVVAASITVTRMQGTRQGECGRAR